MTSAVSAWSSTSRIRSGWCAGVAAAGRGAAGSGRPPGSAARGGGSDA